MHQIQEVVNYLNSIPASEWQALGAYLGGSALVASLLQVAKHRFNFAEAQKLVVFALGVISFLVAFADFILQNAPSISALPWLSHVTGLLMAGAVAMHRFAISPSYYWIENKLQQFSKALKEVEAEEQAKVQLKAVAATASGVPEEASLVQFQV